MASIQLIEEALEVETLEALMQYRPVETDNDRTAHSVLLLTNWLEKYPSEAKKGIKHPLLSN